MTESLKNSVLLVNGENAFPEIIRCIRNARKEILINMFIWRNDAIGNLIASELLDAAGRGVRITVFKDRYGIICELCEEDRSSFFHERPTFSESVKIGALHALYSGNRRKISGIQSDLQKRFLSDPNIEVHDTENTCDHSKFYIFDRETLILGGINIEDKENGKDDKGRIYSDLMVKTADPDAVDCFLRMREFPDDAAGPFCMNLKKPVKSFRMENRYISLIRSAEKSIDIVMAYFSPVRSITDELIRAASDGIMIRILIPGNANFQNQLNRRTVSELKQKAPSIRVFMSGRMLHTKLVMSEKEISFGSCNITKKAFNQLDELNLCVPNEDSDFCRSVAGYVGKMFSEAAEKEYHEIKFSRSVAFAESLLV